MLCKRIYSRGATETGTRRVGAVANECLQCRREKGFEKLSVPNQSEAPPRRNIVCANRTYVRNLSACTFYAVLCRFAAHALTCPVRCCVDYVLIYYAVSMTIKSND